jgi:GT2 family glycosyltransferase
LSSSTVAIVILNFNGKKHLETFLPSVMNTSYSDAKIIIADNGSTDESLIFLAANYPSITCLQRETNEGFAGGYNWALALVEADYYVLLNSDVEVTPNWLEPMVSLLDSNIHVAACQPKILSFTNKDCFEYAGASGGWIDTLGYPFSRGRIFDICEKDNGQYDASEPIFWATGASLFIRASCYKQVGGLDESFFAHQEEIDLCWRLQRVGYTIMSCPSSVVYHVGGGTLPRGGRKVFLNFRNNLLMLGKNLPVSELIWKIPIRFCLDSISAWKGVLQGDFSFFYAIVKAHMSVVTIWTKQLLSGERKRVLTPKKPLTALKGVFNGSIIWCYFVKKQTKFSEIILSKRM